MYRNQICGNLFYTIVITGALLLPSPFNVFEKIVVISKSGFNPVAINGKGRDITYNCNCGVTGPWYNNYGCNYKNEM